MSKSAVVGPKFEDGAVEALWRRAAPKVLVRERRKRAAVRGGLATAALALLVGGLWLRGQRPLEIDAEGAQLAALETPSQFTLSDGSKVEVEPQASLTVEVLQEGEVRLALARGKARFQVSKNKARSFRVAAGDVEVRVVGTRFTVDREAAEVTVLVEEGIVEVRHGASLEKLTAGQRWDSASTAPASALEPVAVEPVAPSVPEPVAAPAPVAAEPVAAAHRPPPAKPAKRAEAAEAAEASSADALFARALEARRGTDPVEAESTLQAFLGRYPKDRRAGVAAFELGRLRMDVSHDNAGALSALSRALSLSPRAAFAEDALARIVQVHHAAGDRRACAEGKAAYMKRYPVGAYAASLAPLCP